MIKKKRTNFSKLIVSYLDYFVIITYAYLLVDNYSFKNYLYLLFFIINLPAFLFFSTIEKYFLIKSVKKHI